MQPHADLQLRPCMPDPDLAKVGLISSAQCRKGHEINWWEARSRSRLLDATHPRRSAAPRMAHG